MRIADSSDMHRIDQEAETRYGLTDLVLMENAGHRAAEVVMELLSDVAGKGIVILAGSGNNGGDAFAAARHLFNAGANIKIFLAGNPAHFKDAARRNHDIDERMGMEITPLDSDRAWERLSVSLRFADFLVDGVLGTGFHGELRSNIVRLAGMVNAAHKPVLSIDMPTGVDADSGAVDQTAIQATVTLTMGLPKVGQFFCPGASYVGRLVVDDIGIPGELLQDERISRILLDDAFAEAMLPPRPADAHKGICGRILVVAGSRGMTGASAMASLAAMRIGAGIVTLAVPESQQPLLAVKLTEVMTCPVPELPAVDGKSAGVMGGEEALAFLKQTAAQYDAVLIGPGLGRKRETSELVRKLAASLEKPVILDADGIYAFDGHIEELAALPYRPILTPHLGEMASLLGISVSSLRRDIAGISRKAAEKYNCVFVVKSECTVVAYPEGKVFFTSKGNPGMATGGAGDVLAGTIAGLVKQASVEYAPLLGVYLHGAAGDLAAEEYGEGLMATDILQKLPLALRHLRKLQEEKRFR